MKQLFATGLMMVWATVATAHSPLEVTVPAGDAVVTEVPSEIQMTFKGTIRLTRVTLTHAGKHSVDLDLDGFSGFLTNYAIPLQSFEAGLYEIEWRGLGDDGHALNGTFNFTVEE